MSTYHIVLHPRQISAFKSPWLQLEPHQPSSSPTKLGIGPRPFYNKHGHRVHPAAVRSPSSTGWSWWIFWWFFAEDFFVEVSRLTREQWKFESKGHDMVETYRASTLRLRWNRSRLKMRWRLLFCYQRVYRCFFFGNRWTGNWATKKVVFPTKKKQKSPWATKCMVIFNIFDPWFMKLISMKPFWMKLREFLLGVLFFNTPLLRQEGPNRHHRPLWNHGWLLWYPYMGNMWEANDMS